MKQTTFDQFQELASRGTFVPVWREIMPDLLKPVSAFLKIAQDSDYAFLFESVEGGAVFSHRGGIELWAKPNGDGSRLDWVPREELFRNRERCEKAVRIALGTVVQREGGAAR